MLVNDKFFFKRNYTSYQERYGHSLGQPDQRSQPSLHDYDSLRSRKSNWVLLGHEENKTCFRKIMESKYFLNMKISFFLLFFVSGKEKYLLLDSMKHLFSVVLLTIVSMDNYYKPQILNINTEEFKTLVKSLESIENNNDKEVDYLLRNSESFTSTTKRPFIGKRKCCAKVRIHSSSVAAEIYPQLLGVYEVLDRACHPPTYK